MSEPPSEALEAEAIDREIESLREQAAALRKTLKVESSTILSSAAAASTIASSASSSSRSNRAAPNDKLISHAAQQQAYMQQCVHRIANSVTAFKVRDPDPNAVDCGHVLGLRFEIMSRGQFLRPYYVMLNRPFTNSKHLRVHRHTIPPAVPLAGLAARHLPKPTSGRGDSRPQDLERFVRELRREIVRYHNRLGVAADLRRSLGLHRPLEGDVSENKVVEIGIADIEAKQMKLTWADERSGRLVMDDDGRVLKLVVMGEQGRDWEASKHLIGAGRESIDVVAKRLQEYSAG
ncbi:Cenp-O kinetochore centromere component-domain-containing protein [Stachybotrys elegans]|uniref:Cenp-O kinetochore centromere component-domain-containing protein n=1 Tax=Stachybotrys elegans TaxID=80388 RepID=A0A8K0SJM9_9HYPO|nr:Cenp-O kinetochore centromere component-domain-containing protein [Stachybotrys elegans]